MKQPILGRLVTLAAQDVWGSEAHVFTPWLSENLDRLAEALHLDAAERDIIEAEFGESLDWQELPTQRASRIAIFLGNVDPSDPAQFVQTPYLDA